MTLPLHDLGLPSDIVVWQAVLLTLLSFGVGVLGGFIGLALGTMRLPALLLVGLSAQTAAGTNIVISTAAALTGALRHLHEGRVDMRIVLTLGLPSFVGAFIGGFGSEVAPGPLLMIVVGLFVVWQGVGLLAAGRRHHPAHNSDERTSIKTDIRSTGFAGREREFAAGLIGLVIGLVGGAIGLILGTVRLPVLVRILRVDPRAAAGANLFIGLLMGLTGWAGHVIQGHVDYPIAGLMAATGMAGSYLGARLTGRVTPHRLLTTMGVVLMTVGMMLVWRGIATGD